MVCDGDAAAWPRMPLPLDRGFWRWGRKSMILFFLCLQFSGKEQTYYQGRHLGEPFGEDWQQTPARQGERRQHKNMQSHTLLPAPPCPSLPLLHPAE